MINASLIDDHHHISIDFDSTLWFEQATDDQIVALGEVEWGNSDETDVVADYFFKKDEDVTKFFTCLGLMQEMGNAGGFSCVISDVDAIKWVTENRSHLLVLMN